MAVPEEVGARGRLARVWPEPLHGQARGGGQRHRGGSR